MKYSDLQEWFADAIRMNPDEKALISEVRKNLDNIIKTLDGQEHHDASRYQAMQTELKKLEQADLILTKSSVSNLIDQLNPHYYGQTFYQDWFQIRVSDFNDNAPIDNILTQAQLDSQIAIATTYFQQLETAPNNIALYDALILGPLNELGKKIQQFLDASPLIQKDFNAFFILKGQFNIPEDFKKYVLIFQNELFNHLMHLANTDEKNIVALKNLKNTATALAYLTTGQVSTPEKEDIEEKIMKLSNPKAAPSNQERTNNQATQRTQPTNSRQKPITGSTARSIENITSTKEEALLHQIKEGILNGKWQISNFKSEVVSIYKEGAFKKDVKIPPSMKAILEKIDTAFKYGEEEFNGIKLSDKARVDLYQNTLKDINEIVTKAANKKPFTIFGNDDRPQKKFYENVKATTDAFNPKEASVTNRPKKS